MRTVLKSTALRLALVAVLLRALVPVGWMPSTAANAAPIMPCPGMAGMHHEMPASQHKSDSHHAKSTYCSCAAVAQLGTPAPDAAELKLAPGCSEIAFAAMHDAPATVSAYRPNAARAPPSLA